MTPREALAVVRDAARDNEARIRMERAGYEASDADEIAAALETLAGCVVLPLGTAHDLVAFGNAVSREWGLGKSEMRSLVEAERAIADAEETMR